MPALLLLLLLLLYSVVLLLFGEPQEPRESQAADCEMFLGE